MRCVYIYVSHVIMAESREKCVLCCFKDHRRTVRFCGTLHNLKEQVKKTFNDVIPDGYEIFLQIKHEGWSGQFIDLNEDEEIADRSIVTVVVEQKEVSISFCWCVYLQMLI